ncbi:hypothetical protein DXO150_07095 [Xanthomonas oryzae pv. oryzae]|nr:hypothetical protein DXO150_07095 [Xanthomonas oryzae pv. oryzae]OLI70339.1 hypothetical protein IXO151_12355 [Xanthomonas oryzae pv. oryzae]OLI89276.1 hypothetical protein IXO278_03415 [Xanthomonas oryzae pv. oryzae]OLI99089.1 hypothetical protein IXO222_10580 [Xanthomonas oryzae pv. oryzae]
MQVVTHASIFAVLDALIAAGISPALSKGFTFAAKMIATMPVMMPGMVQHEQQITRQRTVIVMDQAR